MPSTYYDLLGVPQTASLREIKDKYRAAARQYHPDVATDKENAARLFIQINRAYRILNDEDRRRHYDHSLQPAEKQPPPPPAPERIDITRTLQQAEHVYVQGQMREARALCATILKQEARHAGALALLGDALIGLGKPDEAAVAFRLSQQISPSPMLQAKLNRLTQTQSRGGVPPAPRTPASDAPPSSPPTKGGTEPKPASLLDRLFHRT